ncbi:amidohydrolase family protein [Fuchsiella alkaliacetigena]|uniref:amidohydrolase family protein n=1 Tax=Fuchsiella alkaliacetigena TaxID=957042 RepID=UPI00200AD430|nr:amidohydrolase family protein [Fuchsiella alkaliacetigena]MCK8825067.1 amidohydrolase family protein [Fuchsiella alkaliacetigena]
MEIKKLTSEEKLIILAGQLIDGIGNKVLKKQAIIIEDQEIKDIIKQSSLTDSSVSSLNNYPQINLNDYTVLPGFIDAHVHLALDGIDFKRALDEWDSPIQVGKRVVKELNNTLNRGIVAVRDGGDKAQIGLQTRNQSAPKANLKPQIVATGKAIHKEGYYGSFLGPSLKNKNQLEKEVEKMSKLGVDQLKVLVSGIISFSEYGKVGAIQFDTAELKQIVKAAHQRNLKVMAHASSEEAVQISTAAGVDSIEHGYFLSEESLKRMAAAKIPWVPTVVPVADQLKVKENYSEQQIEVITRSYQRQLEMVERAQEIGVQLGIGTDAGAYQVLHGFSYFRELELFNQTSLSPLQIIKMATANNAQIVGLAAELGSIEATKRANLLAVKGDPLEEFSLLAEPEMLFFSPQSNAQDCVSKGA